MRSALRRIAFAGEIDLTLTEALRAQGVRVERIDGTSVVAVARELMRMRPAVVHARTAHLKVALVARLLDIPFVVEAGPEDLNAITARASRGAARTVCATAFVREALVDQGAPSHSVAILRGLLRPGRDLAGTQVFPPVLDPSIRWVVCVAPSDGPDRGHSDLLLAFLSLARTRPRLRLLVAGAGSTGRALSMEAEHAGMRGRVLVHPLTIDQLPGVLIRAAAVVCPSRCATLPDAVPEALALGAPVVATAVGQHPSWIREGRTGWLVPPRSPAALAARLAQVIDDRALAARVGASARAAVLELTQPSLVALELSRFWASVSRPASAPFTGLYLPETGRTVRV